MNKSIRPFAFLSFALLAVTAVYASDMTKSYEMPDASQIVKDDLIPGATKYTMPKDCKLDDLESIARGEYMFHNLNSKNDKKENLPKGMKAPKEGEVKAYGNCVACHNIEGAVGGGTVGPPLVGYKANFMDTKVRDAQFVYQKIADPRVDANTTAMTINLTSQMFDESEICDITAYVIQAKKEKIRKK
ncbi:MAG: Sulfur oxidation protein SoxX [uncultured Sulfurovum sp.]|uniref:Sulfur oxidation protein SoxX n=1 Tax=uncultured Sulfurovum sp. TaxID=269237 RepID=A0A6S6TDC1_9BACT|nr:MAG: Sulfur oxidation protein SoxX [uncultured Sulfurovum sp.]